MLKSLAVILVLANAGYLAWTQGWLYRAGLLPSPWPYTEPTRMAQQLRDDYLRVIHEAKPALATSAAAGQAESKPSSTSDEVVATDASPSTLPTPGNEPPAPPASTAATAAARCTQLSGTLTDRQFSSLRSALTDVLPDTAWAVSTLVQPARWIVYSGRFASADTLAARKAELKQLQVEFRDVSLANLQPGLAMGTYSTETGAQQALRDVTKAGVKGAKVVIERPEATLYTFKLPEATDASEARLKQLMDSLPTDILKGKTLQSCS